MAGIALAKHIADWDLLLAALKSRLADLPHLNPHAQELETLITEARSLDLEQQTLRGRLQDTVKKRRTVERRGRDLRSRLAAQLRGALGFDNDVLLGFGVPPRRPRRKKSPAGPPPPETPEAKGSAQQ
ncbi:MAG TPA: hypothetical protein VF789_18490 [Thermoanaerobaculia bacterium]